MTFIPLTLPAFSLAQTGRPIPPAFRDKFILAA
jgi:hypothetical protein